MGEPTVGITEIGLGSSATPEARATKVVDGLAPEQKGFLANYPRARTVLTGTLMLLAACGLTTTPGVDAPAAPAIYDSTPEATAVRPVITVTPTPEATAVRPVITVTPTPETK